MEQITLNVKDEPLCEIKQETLVIPSFAWQHLKEEDDFMSFGITEVNLKEEPLKEMKQEYSEAHMMGFNYNEVKVKDESFNQEYYLPNLYQENSMGYTSVEVNIEGEPLTPVKQEEYTLQPLTQENNVRLNPFYMNEKGEPPPVIYNLQPYQPYNEPMPETLQPQMPLGAEDQQDTTDGNTKLRYGCVICNRSFSTYNYLKVHSKTIHLKQKPLECEYCGKEFTWNYQLTQHMRTHTAEKPFECDICKKCFARHDSLKLHKRLHTSDNPYPYSCDTCQKAFTHTYLLKRHMQMHTGEKPFKCDICNKCFTRNYILKRHMRTHSE